MPYFFGVLMSGAGLFGVIGGDYSENMVAVAGAAFGFCVAVFIFEGLLSND